MSGTLQLAPGVNVAADAVELSYSRSSGPGGQNVNKVSTRCELRIALSRLPLHAGAIDRLKTLAGHKVTEAGELIIAADTSRSQGANREECFERLRELLVRAMVEPKRRKKTKPTKGSKERRLSEKKVRSDVKRRRNTGGSRED